MTMNHDFRGLKKNKTQSKQRSTVQTNLYSGY